MQHTDAIPFKLGRGGEILQDQNQDLIAQIETLQELTPTELLKLAIFYQTYQTNQPISNHLALLALKGIVSNPHLQKGLVRHDHSHAKFATIVALAVSSPKSRLRRTKPSSAGADTDLWDLAEDYFNGAIDAEDNSERHAIPQQTLSVKWLLFSGVGLLIEIQRVSDGTPLKLYYIIGVCPDPAGLTAPEYT